MSLLERGLVEVEYYDEASRGFVSDIYRLGKGHNPVCDPSPAGGRHRWIDDTALLTVAKVMEVNRHYKKDAITVYQAVCFDGSMGFVKLTFNTGLTKQILDEDALSPGSTIELIDYAVIWQHPDENNVKKAVIFVKQFRTKAGPVSDQADDDKSVVTPEHSSVWIHLPLLFFVMRESVLAFGEAYKHEDHPITYWAAMTSRQMEKGLFLEDETVRNEYLSVLNKEEDSKKRSINCQCTSVDYCLSKCILESYPLTETDEDELFFACRCRLGDSVFVNKWDELSRSHKRWCYYWYYAVNVFHFGPGEAKELPACFVAAVRNEYPDENGSYTGFKKKKYSFSF
jgi:hypothetical protein